MIFGVLFIPIPISLRPTDISEKHLLKCPKRHFYWDLYPDVIFKIILCLYPRNPICNFYPVSSPDSRALGLLSQVISSFESFCDWARINIVHIVHCALELSVQSSQMMAGTSPTSLSSGSFFLSEKGGTCHLHILAEMRGLRRGQQRLWAFSPWGWVPWVWHHIECHTALPPLPTPVSSPCALAEPGAPAHGIFIAP